MQRIDADLLVPGRGAPMAGGTVILDHERISYAGPTSAAPDTPGAVVQRAPVVMPGLWDCHAHFFGMRTHGWEQIPLEPLALRAARCARDLRAALDAGITSVREVGGLGVHLARAVAEGTLDGPTIYGAGAVLSATGGHGDIHAYPLDWFEDFCRHDGMFRLADGPAECARAVREQLRVNARLIKVCASGGVLSTVDDPIHQQLTMDELRAIVEVAGLAERAVAAHCHGKPGIIAALRAGVRTIEHGTYLDDECCDAMLETGAVLVPTRTIIETLLAGKDGIPPYARAKVEAIGETHAESVARAHERGVTIAAGTDLGLTTPGQPGGWGQNGTEPMYLSRLGLTPLEAIEAATATAPATLGPQAPLSGQLAAGYDADMITLSADPVADISVLASPANVTGVWVRGRQVKG
jgi:imidazolonepropionase-like amidohydrolase